MTLENLALVNTVVPSSSVMVTLGARGSTAMAQLSCGLGNFAAVE